MRWTLGATEQRQHRLEEEEDSGVLLYFWISARERSRAISGLYWCADWLSFCILRIMDISISLFQLCFFRPLPCPPASSAYPSVSDPLGRALDAAFYCDASLLWRFFLMPLLKVWVTSGALFSLTA